MFQINRYRSSMANQPTPPKAKTIRSKLRPLFGIDPRTGKPRKYMQWLADMLEAGNTVEEAEAMYNRQIVMSKAAVFGGHPTKRRAA